MKVTLIGMSKPTFDNASLEDVTYTALSQCYNQSFDMDNALETPKEHKDKIIKAVLNSGHESVAEHTSFTFLIEGCSLNCTHQLVRHRIAAYSQKSSRYTKLDEGDWYVVPASISKNPKALQRYIKNAQDAEDCYYFLVGECGIPFEDARFALPSAKKTNIVVTMNCRALKNFFAHRLCNRAQWEIRAVAQEMAKLCKYNLPVVFEDAKFGYAKCEQLGYCPESKKHNCGKMKTLPELLSK